MNIWIFWFFFLSRGIFRVKYILNVSYRCYDGDVNVSYIWVLYFTHIKISTKLLNLWSTNHHLLEPCIWVYDLFSPFAFAISFVVSETRSTLRYRSKTFTRPLGLSPNLSQLYTEILYKANTEVFSGPMETKTTSTQKEKARRPWNKY